jgi:acyl-CoA synthetase (AMP-forming)/AMP-acid ligase II
MKYKSLNIGKIVEENLINSKNPQFTYLEGGEKPVNKTYGAIVSDAKKVAYFLANTFEPQTRILLMYPPGLDFISSLLGCFYAGMIAVPTYPLPNSRHAYRLHSLIDSCMPELIFGTEKVLTKLNNIDSLAGIKKIATETLFRNNDIIEFAPKRAVTPEMIAFLQYTSGSTDIPKGAIVSHENLMHNLHTIKQSLGLGENKTSVIWLPFQHDLGLVSGVLSSLYSGNNLVLLPPAAVIPRPFVWLKALSDYKAYYTAGPNFSYQLCVDKISEEEIDCLDLSSVGYAAAAAEPNYYHTMEQFLNRFKRCGFKRSAYCVAYGLAEATLHVTVTTQGTNSQYLTLSKHGLENSVIKKPQDNEDKKILMAAGTLHPEHEIAIVNPETLERCAEDEIGEIWVHSKSVAQGYWNNYQAAKETFNIKIKGESKPYLRTGDLGFISGNQLYITGRHKDLVIINGRNLYPQDIEYVVEKAHEFIMPGSCAVFSVEEGTREAIVVCAEIKRTAFKKDLSEVVPAIERAITETFWVEVASVQLLKPGQALKTTSGKIRRKETKKAYLNKQLEVITF